MSFFKKIFSKKQKNTSPNTLQTEIEAEKAEFETLKLIETIQEKLKVLELKVEKKQDEVKKMESRIRKLIKLDQKPKAKTVLRKVKAKREQIIRLHKHINILNKQLINLESSKEDKELLEMMKLSNQVLEKQQQNAAGLEDELIIAKELEDQRKENDAFLDELFEDDEDELEDMMKEYEKEEKEEEFAEVTYPSFEVGKPLEQEKKKENIDDLLDALLNE